LDKNKKSDEFSPYCHLKQWDEDYDKFFKANNDQIQDEEF